METANHLLNISNSYCLFNIFVNILDHTKFKFDFSYEEL